MMHYLARPLIFAVSYSLLVAFIEQAILFIFRLYTSKLQRKTRLFHSITPTITPLKHTRTLHDFDYRDVEPIRYRPFESKRHVTMGVKKSTKDDWIRIDREYMDRMTLRKQLLKNSPETCMGSSEVSAPSIRELYEEVLLDLLPNRYPSMFSIDGDTFSNSITGSKHCISAMLHDPEAMLRILGENVEEDFYFMVPDPQKEFILQGFVSCFPQGFLPRCRVGMSVSQIHEPVPGYEERLKNGVNKCFKRLEPGQSLSRMNWAIQLNHDKLYLPFEGANTVKDAESSSKIADFDPSRSYLRVEHHTLICLRKTGTIVFAVRTYITPLTEIIKEGSASLLAEACESMPEKFAIYKNRPTWGPKLCAWLREGGPAANHPDTGISPIRKSCPFSAQSPSEEKCPFVP